MPDPRTHLRRPPGQSLEFYRLLGFWIRYERPEERFAYLERDGADLMLEQPTDHERLYPHAPLAHPYGRGINLTIDVDDVAELHAVITAIGRELFLPLEDRWYARRQPMSWACAGLPYGTRTGTY